MPKKKESNCDECKYYWIHTDGSPVCAYEYNVKILNCQGCKKKIKSR